MFERFRRFLIEKFLSDTQVERRYVGAGGIFGDAVSYIYMGECIGFAKLLTNLTPRLSA